MMMITMHDAVTRDGCYVYYISANLDKDIDSILAPQLMKHASDDIVMIHQDKDNDVNVKVYNLFLMESVSVYLEHETITDIIHLVKKFSQSYQANLVQSVMHWSLHANLKDNPNEQQFLKYLKNKGEKFKFLFDDENDVKMFHQLNNIQLDSVVAIDEFADKFVPAYLYKTLHQAIIVFWFVETSFATGG